MALHVGEVMPDFVAADQHGEQIDSRSLRGGWLVVFFYPKDGTPVCTAQACALRDAFADLKAAGVRFIGVSRDGDESHRTFAAAKSLGMPLISDVDGSLAAKFELKKWLGLLPPRATFVMDPSGVVRGVCTRWWSAKAHANMVRRVIKVSQPPAPGHTPRQGA